MFSFRDPMRTLAVGVCAFLLLPQTSSAYDRSSKWWFQGDLEAGYQQIDPKVANELSKSGLLLAGRGLLEYRTDSWGALGVGLGLQQTWQDGETDVRIQKYILRSGFVDASYLYPFASRFFWIGWLARTQIGEGARYEFFSAMDKVEGLITTGPQIRLNFATDKWDWVVGAAALTAINSNNRTILNFPIYAGIAIPLGKGDRTESSSTDTTPKYESAKAQAHARPLSVQFELDKSLLTPKARDFLTRLAQVLIKHDSQWKTLTITGHTDASGERGHNQKLSQRRAETVKAWLMREGVPVSRMMSEGQGVGHLLADLNSYDPAHRRAELHFQPEVKNEKLKEALNSLAGEE